MDDDTVEYISKDRPSNRGEDEIVPLTVRIDYDTAETYQNYASVIENLVETKYGELGATNFQFTPPETGPLVAQHVLFDARVGVADELEDIKLGDGIETALFFGVVR